MEWFNFFFFQISDIVQISSPPLVWTPKVWISNYIYNPYVNIAVNSVGNYKFDDNGFCCVAAFPCPPPLTACILKLFCN